MSNDITTAEGLVKQIQADEGFRSTVYIDSLGNPTVGWGHYDPNLVQGEKYDIEQLRLWFKEDMHDAIDGYIRLDLQLDKVRQAVLIMMVFNMGYSKVTRFKKMLGHLVAKNYEMAGVEMLKSRWRKQVKGRAHDMAAAMITGEWV